MRVLLVVSLALNVALLLGAGVLVARVGGRPVLDRLRGRPAPRPDFATMARRRFVQPTTGAVVLLGDSQLDHAPLTDLLALPVRNRALSGARATDLGTWLDGVLAERPAHVVLMIGSNDVYFERPLGPTVAAVRDVLDRVAAQVGCPVTVVSVPPIAGRAEAVRQLNAALAAVAAEHGHRWVDIATPLAGTDWTDDGLHLSGDAYRRVAPAVLAAVRDTSPRH